MAVGTKQGCLCLYGRPGVEMSSSHDSGAAVLQLFFLPGQGRIVALLEDNTLHLWQVRISLTSFPISLLASLPSFFSPHLFFRLMSLSTSSLVPTHLYLLSLTSFSYYFFLLPFPPLSQLEIFVV